MRPCLPPEPPTKPRKALPVGTVDTHCHVVGPKARFPFAPERSYNPPDATVSDYRKMRDTLGIDRAVLLSPMVHGYDNRAMLYALEQLGDTARGVATLPPDVSDEEIAALHERGVRGVRLSSLQDGRSRLRAFAAFAERLAPFGWHIDLYLEDADEIFDFEDSIRASPVPVVLEHMARVRGEAGPSSDAFQCLLDLLLLTPHCWTKITSFYRLSYERDWSDMREIVQQLIRSAGDKLFWGTNWPHLVLFDPPVPDDATLADWFVETAGDHAHRILVDNPADFYGFDRA